MAHCIDTSGGEYRLSIVPSTPLKDEPRTLIGTLSSMVGKTVLVVLIDDDRELLGDWLRDEDVDGVTLQNVRCDGVMCSDIVTAMVSDVVRMTMPEGSPKRFRYRVVLWSAHIVTLDNIEGFDDA